MTNFSHIICFILFFNLSNHIVEHRRYIKDLSPHIRLGISKNHTDNFGDFRLSCIGEYKNSMYGEKEFLVKGGSRYIVKINYIIPADGDPKNKYLFKIDQYIDTPTSWKVIGAIQIDLGHKVYNKIEKLIHIHKDTTTIRPTFRIEHDYEANTVGDLIIKEFKMDLVGARNLEP